tara:strand:+ start:6576 stop:6818 length:243 start_codon:yes stop_codon:yes gene_type:complete
MKYLITFIVMTIGFVFLPWWGTFFLGVLTLIYTQGHVALLFTILLDFYALPQEFPYASGIFLLLMVLAHIIKDRMFDGVE